MMVWPKTGGGGVEISIGGSIVVTGSLGLQHTNKNVNEEISETTISGRKIFLFMKLISCWSIKFSKCTIEKYFKRESCKLKC